MTTATETVTATAGWGTTGWGTTGWGTTGGGTTGTISRTALAIHRTGLESSHNAGGCCSVGFVPGGDAGVRAGASVVVPTAASLPAVPRPPLAESLALAQPLGLP